ncbi:unnamed protein product [Caenorhabditis auriculariae]|uniref:Uncharacterized protein n=1 Tax=Caenorhabditis auriculariae TaxID=2777116 RepID=A0A8S1GSN8_9PELO|nr:unnamed protein product [Caenorhabditis auriculariae]
MDYNRQPSVDFKPSECEFFPSSSPWSPPRRLSFSLAPEAAADALHPHHHHAEADAEEAAATLLHHQHTLVPQPEDTPSPENKKLNN